MTLTFNDAVSRGEVTPIILLGAPRSGTQMYRDMICSHAKVATWPYNEMTYMWRYGNRAYPTDELPPELLTQKTATYIRNAFIKLSRKTNSPMVLDKTCHNCLRPDFVRAVLPEARYIYLIRHGMDVVASMVKRSESLPPYREYARVFSIPPGDIFYYATRALWNHGGLFWPGKRSVRVWGPRFKGMNELAATRPAAEVLAFQWRRHMELADAFLECEDFDSPVLRVRYEEITEDPSGALKQVFDFLGLETPRALVDMWIDKVRYRPPGSSASQLGEYEAAVLDIVAAKNAEHRYA